MTTLLTLLILLIINSLLCLGIWSCAYFGTKPKRVRCANGKFASIPAPNDKMALWWLKYYGDKWLPVWIQKPLYDCPTCMASVHSTYVYWFWQAWTIDNLIIYPFYVLALAGLNSLLSNIGNDSI